MAGRTPEFVMVNPVLVMLHTFVVMLNEVKHLAPVRQRNVSVESWA